MFPEKARWIRPRGRSCFVALSAALFLLIPAWASSGSSSLTDLLAVDVRRAGRGSTIVGVHIVALPSGEPVFNYRANELRIAASNTKLFTTAAALEILGPGYAFETALKRTGQIENGELLGDLAVIGGGDPNISGRHHQGDSYVVFRRWAEELKRLGVGQIVGDIYLVHGFFEDQMIHPDWPEDQLDRWYEAPVSALSFNDNCVLVKAWPGGRAGAAGKAEVLPQLAPMRVRNGTQTTSRSSQHVVSMRRPAGGDEVSVSGSLYRHAKPVEKWMSVEDPVAYFGAALRETFRQQGIEISGELVSRRDLPAPSAQWKTVAIHRSDLLLTMGVINKRSQNFYAESLLKNLGASQCGSGSWAASLGVVEEFLEGVGLEPDSYSMADGSGMSRNNRFTPAQITELLAYMFNRPLGRVYLNTLPHSGEPGLRWEKRLADPPYRGNVLAKTGGLTGVSTLSGYAKARSGNVYGFSILLNQIRGQSAAKASQDQILRTLIDAG